MKNILVSIVILIFGGMPIWAEEIVVPLLETKVNLEYRMIPYAQCMMIFPGFGVVSRERTKQYDVNAVFSFDGYLVQASRSYIYFPKERGFNMGAGIGLGIVGGFRNNGMMPGIVFPLFIGYEGGRGFVSLDVPLSVSPISLIIAFFYGGPAIIPLPALKAGFSF